MNLLIILSIYLIFNIICVTIESSIITSLQPDKIIKVPVFLFLIIHICNYTFKLHLQLFVT